MEFRMLGELEVWQADERVPIHGAIQRSVLTLLLLRANAVVRVEDIVDETWGESAPGTAPKMIKNAVSKLRKSGMAHVLATRAGGYMLEIEPEQSDVARYERLVEEAREALAAGGPAEAQQLLDRAESLWRGEPLADVIPGPFALNEIARLAELRLVATECAIDAELALGLHRTLPSTIERLVLENPLRETLRMKLMLSLYRSGRQAEALAAYQAARAYLRDEVGLEPSAALQRLEQSILQQDPALDLEFLATAPSRSMRKTLTVVHADLSRHGREVDPEALVALSNRLQECLVRALTAHGGTVSSATDVTFVGIFGFPTLAEDDALRAVRAAAEIRSSVEELNESLVADWGLGYDVAIGVATGKTLVDPTEARAATGEVFAGAARLARLGQTGEIRLAASTRSALQGALQVEAVESADGAEPSWRLLAVDDAPARAPVEGPLVGREWELAQIRHAYDRTTRERRSSLVTVLGPAGIGKSRLAREFATTVAGNATVLSGRCPSYGAGVTLWPVAEIVREAAGATTREAIAALAAADPDADEIAARVAGAIGSEQPAGSAHDVFWAIGRLFAAQARDRTLVIVFDDLQWAEPMLVDLLDQLADATRDAPVLLLCLARSERMDAHTQWGVGKLNAATILLEPLSQPECEELISHFDAALDPAVATRVAEAAEGNPLFLEHMVAMAREAGIEAQPASLPPTIEALLAARLDRLGAAERAVLERGSVVGKEFSLGEVTALSPEAERSDLRARVDQLVRRELIGPVAAPRRGDPGFRFRHGLMRDAAYEALPKSERANLHEQLAEFLRGTPDHIRGSDEVLGFHLEQAHRNRVELGQPRAEIQALADRASALLAAAGRRAYARDDVQAAVSLLERAAALGSGEPSARSELLTDLGEAVRESGDYARAEAVLAEAIETAAGHEAIQEYARLIRLRMRVQTDPDIAAATIVAGARRALDVFGGTDDARSLAKAWELLGWGHWLECHAAATEEALAKSLHHARSVGDSRTAAQSLHLTLGATVFGPRPVPEGIAFCEEILADGGRQKRLTASALRALAALKAMAGDFEEARWLLERFAAIVVDIGLRVTAASAAETTAEVELLAGDPEAAERQLRPAYEELAAMGEASTSVNLAALLARALHAQGRDREALAVCEVTAAEDDVSARVHLAVARAGALAAVGQAAEARTLAEAAVALSQKTDFLVMRGDAFSGLAEIALRSSDADRGAPLLRRALALYTRKEHRVAIERTQEIITTTCMSGVPGLSFESVEPEASGSSPTGRDPACGTDGDTTT